MTLQERLRMLSGSQREAGFIKTAESLSEAADTLDAQEKRIKKLETALIGLGRMIDRAREALK